MPAPHDLPRPSRRRILAAASAAAAASFAPLAPQEAVAATAARGAAAATAGPRSALTAFPLADVRLLESPFLANMRRTCAYLLFVDPDRLLHTFRLNVGLPSAAEPCGGWEAPGIQLRGHTTGHLLSALAQAYAHTGDDAYAAKARSMVSVLAECQRAAPAAGYHPGYLSAFPESVFDQLEAAWEALGPLLHPPQDHGGAARQLRTGWRPAGVGRAAGHGGLGGRPHGAALRRADAVGAEGGVRRYERRTGPPPPPHG